MLTVTACLDRYGQPKLERNMILWDVPPNIQIGVIPKRIYCNKDLIKPLSKAFEKLIKTGHVNDLKTWDGCFNIRQKRNGKTASFHSWGLAIDINASWNRMGKKPTQHPGLVECFTSSGFEWGGTWKEPDGMHFQLADLP